MANISSVSLLAPWPLGALLSRGHNWKTESHGRVLYVDDKGTSCLGSEILRISRLQYPEVTS